MRSRFIKLGLLLADERRVIAMTTMGYGRSDRPAPPYTTVRQYAEAAIAFLDALGVERTSVIGSHTGSLLAVEIAAGWPQRVDRLILGEPFDWNTLAYRSVAGVLLGTLFMLRGFGITAYAHTGYDLYVLGLMTVN